MPDSFESFSWTHPYSSQREPICGESVVATSQPLAAQAGLEMLRRGGTAADAAVATAIAMTVLEPTTNAIGSDAFALVWDGTRVNGLNGSGRSAAAMTPERFAGKKGVPHAGWDPVNVPGAVSAWVALWKKFGVLSFGDLFEPAIHYARDGFLVAPQTAALWQSAVKKKRYEKFPEWTRVFTIDGRAPRAGERMRLPDHALTLAEIARSEGESFYRGPLAARMAKLAKDDGGLLNEQDFAAHAADWVDPISTEYHGIRLHEIPPNGQGIVALMALAMLRSRDLRQLEPDCPDAVHLAIEAMKLAFAEGHREVADPHCMKMTPAQMLDDARLAELSKKIDPTKAQDFKHGPPNPGGTILLCAADRNGMMVSFIQSNYEGWGSGIVVPGTGIALNNRGANFTLEKGHPNEIAGAKRPYHTIIPGMVTTAPAANQSERALMTFGVMGGFMQPQGHLQVLLRMADHHWNPQAALDAPRWQVTKELEIEIEPGFREDLYEELQRRGHVLKMAVNRNVSFGRGQAIVRLEDSKGYVAGSDLRADGQAVAL